MKLSPFQLWQIAELRRALKIPGSVSTQPAKHIVKVQQRPRKK